MDALELTGDAGQFRAPFRGQLTPLAVTHARRSKATRSETMRAPVVFRIENAGNYRS
jgi:hypothetical protein